MGVERLSLNNFTNPLVRKKTADLKLIESQIFIQQRWVYSRSAETEIQDLQPCTAPKAKGKWILSSKGKGHWEGYSKKEKSFWLFVGGILARKEEEFFLLGSALSLLSPKYFKLKLLCINFNFFPPSDQNLSLRVTLIKGQVFQFQWLFVPQYQKYLSWI